MPQTSFGEAKRIDVQGQIAASDYLITEMVNVYVIGDDDGDNNNLLGGTGNDLFQGGLGNKTLIGGGDSEALF